MSIILRAVIVALCVLLPSSLAFAQSIAKARLLHANKLVEDAKREAIAVVFSEASDSDKADAMSLLGTIAVDEADYASAVKNWTELLAKYPSSPAARDAALQLPLVKKLAEGGSSPTPDEPNDEGAVMVAGVAPEHPAYADQAVMEFMNFLQAQGVKTNNAFSGRFSDATAGRNFDVTLPNLLKLAQQRRATSVLYVYIHFKGMENMRVECYSSAGKKLWQEKVAASFGFSPSGMTEGFVRRMKTKLQKHVGGPCLPRVANP